MGTEVECLRLNLPRRTRQTWRVCVLLFLCIVNFAPHGCIKAEEAKNTNGVEPDNRPDNHVARNKNLHQYALSDRLLHIITKNFKAKII